LRYLFVNGANQVWGAEESMVSLARSLEENGNRVRLECFSSEVQQFWRKQVNPNASMVGDGANNISNIRKCLLYLRQPITKESVDAVIVFNHFLYPKIAFEKSKKVLGASRKKEKIIWVVDLHDNFKSIIGFFNFKILVRFADRVLAVSDYTAAQLPKSMRQKILVIRRGLDSFQRLEDSGMDIGMKHSIPGKPLRVGIVGRLDEEKNHKLLMQAMLQTTVEHKLIVRGSVSESSLEFGARLISTMNQILGHRLQFEGKVPRNQALDNLDLLVVCNSNEPMGRTVLEAMEKGVLAIVPDKGGSSEIVEHLVNGLRYKSNNVESLAQTIDFAADNPKKRFEMIQIANRELEVEGRLLTYGQSVDQFIKNPENANRIGFVGRFFKRKE
jgi:glycosyltransferase involved in cell wall biosynthesis